MICNCDNVPPNCASSGLVNNVQIYCRLEIAIMQMMPAANCTHLVALAPVLAAEPASKQISQT